MLASKSFSCFLKSLTVIKYFNLFSILLSLTISLLAFSSEEEPDPDSEFDEDDDDSC